MSAWWLLLIVPVCLFVGTYAACTLIDRLFLLRAMFTAKNRRAR